MKQKREYDFHFKIILLGDNCVGKSCLLQSYFKKLIDFYEYIDTYGVDAKLTVLKIFNQLISLRIWDASGNPKVRALVTPYLRDIDGALICFDLTDMESFQKVKGYVDIVRTYKKNASILLLGCKADLISKRAVSYEQVKELADELGFDYLEVSARKEINVKEGFELITLQLYYAFQINKIRVVLEELLNDYLKTEVPKNRSGLFLPLNEWEALRQEYQNNVKELLQSKHVSAMHDFCTKTLDLIKRVDVLFEKEHPFLNFFSSSPLSDALKQSLKYVLDNVSEEIIDFPFLKEPIAHNLY